MVWFYSFMYKNFIRGSIQIFFKCKKGSVAKLNWETFILTDVIYVNLQRTYLENKCTPDSMYYKTSNEFSITSIPHKMSILQSSRSLQALQCEQLVSPHAPLLYMWHIDFDFRTGLLFLTHCSHPCMVTNSRGITVPFEFFHTDTRVLLQLWCLLHHIATTIVMS